MGKDKETYIMNNPDFTPKNAEAEKTRILSGKTAISRRSVSKWVVVGIIGFAVIGCRALFDPKGLDQTPVATAVPSSTPEAPSATQVPTLAETPTAVEPVTITWWQNSISDYKTLLQWEEIADDYMAAHPNVTIEITMLENEAFKTRLASVMQSGDPPDIFQSWGGSAFNQQVEAGLLKDITADLDADGEAWRDTFAPGALGVYSYQGRNYGVPWDMEMAGWWYNKALFAQAGIAAPPETWTEFLADVKKLKAAGITPISLGEADTWTGMLIWSYLATRICGEAGFEAAENRTGSFTDPCFVEAGRKLQELIALKPFQQGYLSAHHDAMQATFGNGKAAMELCGFWAPAFQASNSTDQKGIGENLGLFSFPAVEGGAGDVTDVIGGGNGFVIGKNAESEAIDFVRYLTSVDNQIIMAENGSGIPVVKGGEAGLSDPNMLMVQKNTASAQVFLMFYDQYLPPSVGSVLNDSVQGLFAGTLTPEQVTQNIEDAAAQELK